MYELDLCSNRSDEASSKLHLQLWRIRDPETECVRSPAQCDLWAFVWGSSVVLSEVVLSLGCALQGCKSFEVGAGSGMSSLSAASCGASARASDIVPAALDLLSANALQNGLTLSTLVLDWNQPELPAPIRDAQFDLVLGADILYIYSAVKPVLRLCARLLADRGVAIVTDPGRTNGDDFEAYAPDYGLYVQRFDFPRLKTAVCNMKLCTVFILTKFYQPLEAADKPWHSLWDPAGCPWRDRLVEQLRSKQAADDENVTFSYRL